MTEIDPKFEALLMYLKESRGFDFTGYKRSSLTRRVDRRMAQNGVHDYSEYQDYLEVHPDEFTTLFNTILINVTGFFRDPETWDYLRTTAVPAMLASSEDGTPIRVWSAGCASGEEPYTLAMMLAEILGEGQFKHRVKIYATDVDEEALAAGRLAVYSEKDLDALPPDHLSRYFEPNGSRYAFRKDLRRSVIFGRNDLAQDAPISRVDLLACRNTLMYFNAETQSRILSRFHFGLARAGLLVLGKAEMLLSHGSLFTPVDLKRRVFCKVARAGQPAGGVSEQPTLPPQREDATTLDRLRTEAFLASPAAQVVVTPDGLVVLSNRQAEHLFGVSSRDIGRPFRDLDISFRPIELRGYIEQAQVERRVTRVAEVEFQPLPGPPVFLEVQIIPLADPDGSLLGVTLVFHDVTSARRLQDELEHANRQLEAAYEELQSTNEELETTNEELHSSVEELETTNEELQSTNEELETMNEELQSTNDELQSINDELRRRTDELDDTNAFLESILSSLRAGVAVLNRDLYVQIWNRRAEDLWGLRQDEVVGQHFLNLDIGLPTEQVRPLLRGVFNGGAGPHETLLSAVNRRGRRITVQVACSALRRGAGGVTGAILVMEPAVAPSDTDMVAQT